MAPAGTVILGLPRGVPVRQETHIRPCGGGDIDVDGENGADLTGISRPLEGKRE